MNNIILIGDRFVTDKYIENYLKENQFTSFEIEYFNNEIKIEDARIIKKKLYYKVTTKKLLVFNGKLTLEAQNSLLKNIEEAAENVYFIFSTSNEDNLLPTIRSRCSVVRLDSKFVLDKEMSKIISSISNEKGNWKDIDMLTSFLEEYPFEYLVPTLRIMLLENIKNDFSKLISFIEIDELELLFILNHIDEKISIYSLAIKSISQSL